MPPPLRPAGREALSLCRRSFFLKMCAVVGAHEKGEVEIWSPSGCVLASSWQKVPSKTCQTAPLTAPLLLRASFSLLRCAKLKKTLDLLPVSLVSSKPPLWRALDSEATPRNQQKDALRHAALEVSHR